VRLLLDECVDRHFAEALAGHDVKTVPEMGWAALKNGELLARAEDEFDVFITVDRALPSQQNLLNRKISLLIIKAKTNQLVDLLPLVPDVLAALQKIKPGQIVVVGQ
jgi:hypothetical protein